MGVLAGRISPKTREGFWGIKRLGETVRSFARLAEKIGLAVNEKEVYFRKDVPGRNILNALTNFGVTACDKGTEFWKGSSIR